MDAAQLTYDEVEANARLRDAENVIAAVRRLRELPVKHEAVGQVIALAFIASGLREALAAYDAANPPPAPHRAPADPATSAP